MPAWAAREMPYAKCPVCGAEFHVSVRADLGEWYRERWPGLSIGDVVPAECFGCWTELREHHVVLVRRRPEGLPSSSPVKLGERGAVVSVLSAPDGSRAYMVECVRPDGSTAWLETFGRRDLSYDIKNNAGQQNRRPNRR